MRLRFVTTDVFTNRVFSGNQLAVFPEAAGLNSQQMQQIAREFNLSETSFVFPPQDPAHTRRVRIFTPAVELPFAGHPTIGTAFVLAATGEIPLSGERTDIVFEENVGLVRVMVSQQHGKIGFCQLSSARLPEFGPPPPTSEAIANALSLAPSDLLGGKFSPQAASCGVPFLFIPLRNREALARARLVRDLWERDLSSYWAAELFLFCFDPELDDSDLRARMFAPAMGVNEDPATGAAATALGGYLGIREDARDGTLRWVIEQGFEMGRPSILETEIDKRDGEITDIRVGGRAVLVSEGWMEIPGS
jgi:trans-2,3-dihydro-3-hydroxyanthranilate isomerase